MHTENSKLDSDARLAAAVKNYEAAVRQMQKQNYEKASEILEKLIVEAPAQVADRARVYARLCNQKLERAGRALKSSEDFYVAGVADLNARRLDHAIENLARAEKLSPRRGEICYALASAYALNGNGDAAIENLEKAIRLDAQCRIQARQDEDLQPIAHDPRFASLVNASGAATGGS